MVGEMKSAEDAATARKYLSVASHHVMDIGETDPEILNGYFAKITRCGAIEEAKVIRGQMVELRDLSKRFASDKP
jgi:hypothetical protein